MAEHQEVMVDRPVEAINRDLLRVTPGNLRAPAPLQTSAPPRAILGHQQTSDPLRADPDNPPRVTLDQVRAQVEAATLGQVKAQVEAVASDHQEMISQEVNLK